MLLVVLGLRRGEVLGLRWGDIDLDSGRAVLRVRHTLQRVGGELREHDPKTARSRRTVPLPEFVRLALVEHRDRELLERWGRVGPDDRVFTSVTGAPIDPRNFSRLFAELCEAAGVRAVRLHDLRHTCVTLLLSLGVPPRVVMEIVGHSAIEMTMNVYAHVSLDMQRDALSRLTDRLDL